MKGKQQGKLCGFNIRSRHQNTESQDEIQCPDDLRPVNMPNIKFGKRFSRFSKGHQQNLGAQEKRDDDIEILEFVKVGEKVNIKEKDATEKVTLNFNQLNKKRIKLEPPAASPSLEKDENQLKEYLQSQKRNILERITEREEKVIKIIKRKDLDLRNLTFERECLSLEIQELKKVIEEREDRIRTLEKKEAEQSLVSSRNLQEMEKLRDQNRKLKLQVENSGSENQKLSEQYRTMKVEVDKTREEHLKMSELLKTEVETSRKKHDKFKDLEDKYKHLESEMRAAKESEKASFAENTKLTEELRDKKKILEEMTIKISELEELKERNIVLEGDLKKVNEELDREKRNHKRELETRIKRTNATIEELKKQVASKDNGKMKEDEVCPDKVPDEKDKQRPAVRDPRLLKDTKRKKVDEARTDNFFSTNRLKSQNPFDQRPHHHKTEDNKMKEILVENERLKKESERQQEIIKKLDHERWYLTKAERQPVYPGPGHYRGRGRGGYFPPGNTFYSQPPWRKR